MMGVCHGLDEWGGGVGVYGGVGWGWGCGGDCGRDVATWCTAWEGGALCAGEWEWELVWVGRVLVVIWLLGCGIARHIKCPSDRVKTSLHEGHDAQPVEEMSMGVPS